MRAGERPRRRACRKCGRDFAVRDDGTLRRHRAPFGGQLDRCSGELERPRPAVWQGPGCGDDCPCRLEFYREADHTRLVFSTGERYSIVETEPGVYAQTRPQVAA